MSKKQTEKKYQTSIFEYLKKSYKPVLCETGERLMINVEVPVPYQVSFSIKPYSTEKEMSVFCYNQDICVFKELADEKKLRNLVVNYEEKGKSEKEFSIHIERQLKKKANYNDSKKLGIPFVIFELKVDTSFSTGEIIAYAEKARMIKSVFPFCQYALIVIGKTDPRVYRYGDCFDEIFSISKVNDIDNLIIDEITEKKLLDLTDRLLKEAEKKHDIFNGQKRTLKSLHLEISNPCNEKCVHCYRTCEHTKKGFLSTKDVKKILKNITSFISPNAHITLTGGEVLLNKEWRDIVEIVSKSGKRFSIFTNGSLMTQSDADYIAGFVGKGLKEVQFSFYAIDEKTHDSVTGLKGSCEKTKNAIQMLKDRGVPIFVSCPAMQVNKDDFYNVMSWCDKNNIPSCADLMIFNSSDYKEANKSQQLTEKDLEDFFEISMQNNGALSYVWGKSKFQRDLSKIDFYGSATDGLCISGDGSIYPMIGWYEKLGNIHTDSIKDIFYNNKLLDKARKYKVSDFPECVKCDANDYCSFCPSAHITANRGELGKLDKTFCDYVRLVKKFAQRRDEILGNK